MIYIGYFQIPASIPDPCLFRAHVPLVYKGEHADRNSRRHTPGKESEKQVGALGYLYESNEKHVCIQLLYLVGHVLR